MPVRGVIPFIILLLIAAYWLLKEDKPPEAYVKGIQVQKNPFAVPLDSSEICWKRAKQLIKERKTLLTGGKVYIHDSLIRSPYYNYHQKGNMLEISRKQINDSVYFYINCMYSKMKQESLNIEVALFMQHGISRY